jgi:hypothetical protein
MLFTSALLTPLTYSSFKHLDLPFALSMPSLPSATNARRATFLLMLIFFVFSNTGCGGTPDYPVDNASGNSSSQTSNASSAADQMKSLSSSFTVNPLIISMALILRTGTASNHGWNATAAIINRQSRR